MLALCLGLLLASAPARAEDAGEISRALLEAGRTDLPIERRLSAAARVLAARGAPEPDAAVQAGLGLLPHAPETAGWLILRGTDAGWVEERVRERGRVAIDGALQTMEDGQARALLAAAGLLLGRRPEGVAAMVLPSDAMPDLVRAVLRRELGALQDAEGRLVMDGDVAAVRAALAATTPVARQLDEATSDDPAHMHAGLGALLAMGAAAVPLLLHEARLGARAEPAGRMARAVRAILALGFMKDRRATPVLAEALTAENGWVRVGAATALGDLGDPAGAVPLAVHLATLGDLYRARDQWDYPGASGTTVSEADWRSVDYFVVDVAAADALLRMGVPQAAGYLIQEKLDPAKANSRIRVYQDAVDTLARALPDAPVGAYNIDAGIPHRERAFVDLAQWWFQHRARPDLLRVRLDETDAGFHRAALELAGRLRGTDVRTFMITKPACALLGRAMTPALIETLQVATKGSACAEIAETLGLVRDPRAIPPLLGLMEDGRPFVRARAAEALAHYVDGQTDVRDALVRMLGDRKPGPRISALKGLVAAPPDPVVLEAVKRLAPATKMEDYARAETVVLLVQEGAAHWPPIEAGLNAEHRYEREGWWGLLRVALDLPEYMHDAGAVPGTPHARRLERDEVLRALQARRSGR